MFKRSFLLITALFGLVALAGCSGSSSSGTGNAYAGVYTGTSTMELRGLGAMVTEVIPLRIVVGVDGQVDVSVPGSSEGSCAGPQVPMSLVGNKASASAENISCSVGDLQCSVSGSFTYTFASDSASQTGSAVMNCNVGRVDVSYSGYVKKTS